jgi:hypothetical protein
VSHCDPETLALRSLGEVVGSPEDDAHLASCPQCQSELASLSRLVLTAKTGGPVTLLAPPDRVWDRIRDEVATDPGLPSNEPTLLPAGRPRPDAEDDLRTDDDAGPVAPVVPLQAGGHGRARRRPAPWLLAAAGIGGIVVGGVGTAAVMTAGSGGSTTSTIEAAAVLDPLPDWDATGEATLSINADGQQVLDVTVDTAAAGEDGFQEVWLIDRDVSGMVSLGPLQGSSGEFVIPAGVDVSQFPIVDVSLEPVDGVPTHSGNSIVRGTLDV